MSNYVRLRKNSESTNLEQVQSLVRTLKFVLISSSCVDFDHIVYFVRAPRSPIKACSAACARYQHCLQYLPYSNNSRLLVGVQYNFSFLIFLSSFQPFPP